MIRNGGSSPETCFKGEALAYAPSSLPTTPRSTGWLPTGKFPLTTMGASAFGDSGTGAGAAPSAAARASQPHAPPIRIPRTTMLAAFTFFPFLANPIRFAYFPQFILSARQGRLNGALET